MTPDGYVEALQFHETRTLPLKSWHHWLQACYLTIDKHYNYACSWPLLVGMSVGMLEELPGTLAEFRLVVAKEYKRPAERRFVIFFVSLIDALAGGTDADLARCYRERIGIGLRHRIPTHPVRWPHSDAPINTSIILSRLQRQNAARPIDRGDDSDFYMHLLYGYYLTTHNVDALDCLYDECLLKTTSPLSIQLIRSHEDKALLAHFSARRARELNSK
jgi:hypothetical protein